MASLVEFDKAIKAVYSPEVKGALEHELRETARRIWTMQTFDKQTKEISGLKNICESMAICCCNCGATKLPSDFPLLKHTGTRHPTCKACQSGTTNIVVPNCDVCGKSARKLIPLKYASSYGVACSEKCATAWERK